MSLYIGPEMQELEAHGGPTSANPVGPTTLPDSIHLANADGEGEGVD